MIRSFLFSFLLLLLFNYTGYAQTAFPDPGEVFRDDVVPRIDIILPESSLEELFTPGNELSDFHHKCTFIFDNGSMRDTVEESGFRLRGNTSRYSAKKSYKISFNTYAPGRKFHGLEKLNINGEHNDPSVIRSKLCWDMLRELQVPASRSNHVHLYVNGNYFGIYINVEHIDEEFADSRFGNDEGNLYKCLWPADLDYLGDNPDLYKFQNGERRTYDLKTNTEKDDYSDLANFINILNNTPTEDLPCQLEEVFNVDTYLRAMVFDVLSGNWDGPLYNKNNFYLYKNIATDQFEYIPYDLDNTFGIDWFNKDWATRNIYDWGKHGEARPLYWKIMEVDEYRNRFSYYMNEFLETYFHPEIVFPSIDDIKNNITPYIQNDPFYPLDYGYTFSDFTNSYAEALGAHVKSGLKPFIETRHTTALQQLDIENIHPILNGLRHNYPQETDDILITVFAKDDGMIQNVELCYQLDEQGDLNCLPMYDDGQHVDGLSGDGTFGIELPALNNAHVFNFFIRATDDTGLSAQNPSCDFHRLYIGNAAIPLFINEFMASNSSVFADEAGEYDDWIELYNGGSEPIYLGDKFLSDNPSLPGKFALPNIHLQSGDFVIFWADKDSEQGVFHANFKLDADGEYIGLYSKSNASYALIDSYEFGAQQEDHSTGRIPNGEGEFQAVAPTPGTSNVPVSVSVKGMIKTVSISAYPNPFFDHLQFFVNHSGKEKIDIQIHDPLGRMVWSMPLSSPPYSSVTWYARNVKPGMYFVNLIQGAEVIAVRKVVKF